MDRSPNRFSIARHASRIRYPSFQTSGRTPSVRANVATMWT
ncbi:hypothetical protein [Actinomadura madurae]|nr:hypothetical protein [Actinomadura madurae]